MWRPTREELDEKLAKHKRWLEESKGWSEDDCADLHDANLCGFDLRNVDLSGADLRGANLSRADLSRADLSGANLRRAKLSGAELTRADLSHANLSRADLSRADLICANLSHADLRETDLSRADLSGAFLNDIKGGELALAMTEIVPREGSLVGWKQCMGRKLVKLRIPEDAKRSSAMGRKCRASKAEVLEITDADGNPCYSARSYYSSNFVYEVGATVTARDFCEDRLQECAAGIHFFLTPEEAKAFEW